jgi:AcrR family transcriptional regulator
MDLKDKIIEAVIEVFNEKGMKFTMEDISRHLGISKRTLYTCVDNKESLFVAAVDNVFSSIKEAEKAIIQDTSMDIIDKLMQILIVIPQKYKTIDFRHLYEVKDKFPRIYNKIENRLETDWEPTFQLLEQAMAEGRIRKISLPVIQAIVSGTIENYLSRGILIENGITYEKAMDDMVGILFNGILVRGES